VGGQGIHSLFPLTLGEKRGWKKRKNVRKRLKKEKGEALGMSHTH